MGYMSGNDVCDEASIRKAMVHGSVVASFGVEPFSLERLADLSKDEIDHRVEKMLAMQRV